MAALGWYTNYELLRKEQINHKIASNMISGYHCLSVLLFNICNGLQMLNIIHFTNYFGYIQNVSIGYYIYDTYICIINIEKLRLFHMMHIYHHIASICFLYIDPIIYMVPQVFLWVELGNIAIYPTYHYIQIKDKSSAKIWKVLQKITYIPVRTLILSYYLGIIYNNIKFYNGRFEPWYMCIVIYILGAYWSISMLLK